MKILFIAPLPPPTHGHSLASKVFYDKLVQSHEVNLVNLNKRSFKAGMDSFERIMQVINIFIKVWKGKNSADIIYFTISESFMGNIKDIFLYLICYRCLDRMVIHLHGGGIKKNLFDKMKWLFLINKFFIKKVGAVIVLGPSLKHIFTNMTEDKKIHIVYNFVEDYIFIDENEIIKKFRSTWPLKIIFLSNFIYEKGYNNLADAFIDLDDELKSKVEIEFAGEFDSIKTEHEFLKRIKNQRGLRYLGFIEKLEKKNALSASHIFCLPTNFYEGQPISILEAYAAGCVVITTNTGGIRDIFVNKINGFEVQQNSYISIKNELEKIIDDPDILLPIAQSNRRIAYEKFRTTTYFTSLMNIIEEVKSNVHKR